MAVSRSLAAACNQKTPRGLFRAMVIETIPRFVRAATLRGFASTCALHCIYSRTRVGSAACIICWDDGIPQFGEVFTCAWVAVARSRANTPALLNCSRRFNVVILGSCCCITRARQRKGKDRIKELEEVKIRAPYLRSQIHRLRTLWNSG